MIGAIEVCQPVWIVDEPKRHLQMKPIMPAMLHRITSCQSPMNGLGIERFHIDSPSCYEIKPPRPGEAVNHRLFFRFEQRERQGKSNAKANGVNYNILQKVVQIQERSR